VAGGAFDGDLAKTKAAEAELFGSTGRRSPLRIVVRDSVGPGEKPQRRGYGARLSAEDLAERWGLKTSDADYQDTVERLRVRNPSDGSQVVLTSPIEYLAFGAVHKGHLVRPRLPPKTKLSFELVWRPPEWRRIPLRHRELFAWALWSWLHLGSIGAKARKGFGSLRCVSVDGDLPEELDALPPIADSSLDKLESGVARLLELTGSAEPGDWSRFSKKSRILVSKARFMRWEAAMEALGAWLIVFRRRYGSSFDSRVIDGVPLANRDYEWADQASDPKNSLSDIPDKAGFGLPLPFDRQGSAVTWVPASGNRSDSKDDRRRASPLLLRVGRFGDDDFRPLLIHLPADLVPKGAELRYRYRSGRDYRPRRNPSLRPSNEQESVVGWFLDILEQERGLMRRVTP